MTPKERIRTALHHEEPDQVPLYVFKGVELINKLAEIYGVPAELNQVGLAMNEDMVIAYGGVVVSFFQYVGAPSDDECPAEFVDEWGLRLRRVSYPGGRYYDLVGHPLSDVAALDSWTPPNPHEPERYEYLQSLLNEYARTHWVVGAGGFTTLFETAWYLRGHAAFLEDLLINKDFAHALLDKLLDWGIVVGRRQVAMGCDMYLIGDDYGTQDRLIMSPRTWREFIKPRYGLLFQELRNLNKDIKLALHSDGNISEIISDLVEIGLDVLQPIQPQCVDPAQLKRRYGKRLTLWGGVDVQSVLPFGTPAEVERVVREIIRILAPGGGYILCPSHNIQPDTPMENVMAFYEAAKKYGSYPIRLQ